jgi:uncharacterized membrane protein
MHILAQRLFLFVFALWVGVMISIGYIVAPTLFVTLSDSQVAGMVAGTLFRIEGVMSLVLGAILIVLANLLVKRGLNAYRNVRWYLLGILICSVAIAFVLQPMMNALREEALSKGFPVMLSPLAQTFGRLHGLSSVFYLVESLLGLVLLWRLTKFIFVGAPLSGKEN